MSKLLLVTLLLWAGCSGLFQKASPEELEAIHQRTEQQEKDNAAANYAADYYRQYGSGADSSSSYTGHGGSTYVRGYTRKDGTRVRSHTRR